MRKFHLSIVATARNDDHGQNFLYRMQHFVDGCIEQCKRHHLDAELILVEWNPPEGRPPLSQALKFPREMAPCAVRIIQVPPEAHRKLSHSDKIPLFQMIGKNVGIRRAMGEYVLCTNVDIIFSDAIIHFLRDQLKPGTVYRADRLDVPSELPQTDSFSEILDFCRENYFRINGKFGTKVKIDGRWENLNPLSRKLPKKFDLPCLKQFFQKVKMRLFYKVHANACGDFTLLSSQDWAELKGYAEWEMYSWHIDEMLLYQAQKAGMKAVDLPREMAIYHIEHGAGSGYTPEASYQLFQRLKSTGIPYFDDDAMRTLVHQMNKSNQKPVFNNENWGLSDLPLEEGWIGESQLRLEETHAHS